MDSKKLSPKITIPSLRPERIIFAVDLSIEMNYDMNGNPPINITSRMDHTRRLLHRFVDMKLFNNPRHQFAIMIITNVGEWVLDYTSNRNSLHLLINKLKSNHYYTTFSLCSLLEELHTRIPPPTKDNKYIYRTILIYGRSGIVPSPINMEVLDELYKNPLFYIDVIYLHSKTSPKNNPQLVYDRLCELDPQEKSYYFQIVTNSERYSSVMLKLLGNPTQRISQDSANFQVM